MCRVQVVYYLSHGGRMEQPHLIEVEQPRQQQPGLCLSEVKKRLTALRGKGMPDAFSWAYKRSYKNDYIWSDVAENDMILPLRDNEYIIKGSENVYCKPESRADHRRMSSIEEEHKSFESPMSYQRSVGHRTPMRASESYEKRSSISSSVAESRSPKKRERNLNCEGALRVNRQLMETLTQAKTESVDEVFCDNPHSDGSSNENNFTDVKVYKTPASPITADHGKDAATQTEDKAEERASNDFHFHSDLQRDQGGFPRDHSSSLLLKRSERVGLFSTARKQLEEAGNRRQANATVLRQLLSCGGIDTTTCSSMQNRLHYHQAQTWACNKSKSDSRSEADVSSKFSQDASVGLSTVDSSRMASRFTQDPESIPEVVKEATHTPPPANYVEREKTSRERVREVIKVPRLASKEATAVEDNGPRVSSATKRVTIELPPLKTQITPPKKEIKCREDRPLTPGRSRLDWEKTLQEAVSANSPPVNFRMLLQECPQCGRTFKPDSLKVHLRGCHSQKSGKIANVARRLE